MSLVSLTRKTRQLFRELVALQMESHQDLDDDFYQDVFL